MDNKILHTAKFTHHDLKFHSLVEIGQKMWKLVQTDGQTDRPIPIYPPQTMFVGGIKIFYFLSLTIQRQQALERQLESSTSNVLGNTCKQLYI
jgi:hypothetical protein